MGKPIVTRKSSIENFNQISVFQKRNLHPPQCLGGLGFQGFQILAVLAGEVGEADVANLFAGKQLEEFGGLHVGEFAAKEIQRIGQQRLEVGRRADVAAVGDAGFFGFQNKTERLKALRVFFLKMLAQSFEVRGGVRGDF